MDLNLRGRSVIIAGPARGMVGAISLAFAAEGCRLTLAGRDVVAIEPVAEKAKAASAEVTVIKCDVIDEAQCVAAAELARSSFGRIDVLVNVAGGSGPVGKSAWETTREEFNDIITPNIARSLHTLR